MLHVGSPEHAVHGEVLDQRDVRRHLGDLPARESNHQNVRPPLEGLETLLELVPADIVEQHVHTLRRRLLDQLPQTRPWRGLVAGVCECTRERGALRTSTTGRSESAIVCWRACMRVQSALEVRHTDVH
eukprot:4044951-Pyramimonas_sp.AAC.4